VSRTISDLDAGIVEDAPADAVALSDRERRWVEVKP
jgi:hypothetical protein